VRGEVPVAALIVDAQGEIAALSGNRMHALGDPTAHAEMLAIREACAKLGEARLKRCDIYVTLEPCAMCAAAISFARLRRLYFGAYDAKGGGVEQRDRGETRGRAACSLLLDTSRAIRCARERRCLTDGKQKPA